LLAAVNVYHLYALHGCCLEIAWHQPTKVSDIGSSMFVQLVPRSSTVVLLFKVIVVGYKLKFSVFLEVLNGRAYLSVCKK